MTLKDLNNEINEDYLKNTITKIIQPEELFKLMQVKDVDEAKKVFNIALSFLVYLKDGEMVETPHAKFYKFSDDTIRISSKLDPKDTVDSLSKKRIIKFLFC